MKKLDKIFAVILAAGESLRMGSPKALLKIHDDTFLEYLLKNINQAEINNTIVVLGCDTEKILNSIDKEKIEKEFKVKFLINENYKSGQLSSIHQAIKHIQNDADAMMLFPVDRPLISSGLIKHLIKVFSENNYPIVLPVFGGKRGHPVIFSSTLFKEILNAPLDIGARAVVWKHEGDILEVQTDENGVVINIDTPDDYDRYIVKGIK